MWNFKFLNTKFQICQVIIVLYNIIVGFIHMREILLNKLLTALSLDSWL